MDNRTLRWIHRFAIYAAAFAVVILLRLGLSVGRIVAILVPILLLFMMMLVYIAPGPRTKGFVDRLKRRFR